MKEIDNQNLVTVMVPISSLGENYNFDYLTGVHKNIKVGDIVKVPFSNKGLIWGVVRNKKLHSNNTKLKTVIDKSKLEKDYMN